MQDLGTYTRQRAFDAHCRYMGVSQFVLGIPRAEMRKPEFWDICGLGVGRPLVGTDAWLQTPPQFGAPETGAAGFDPARWHDDACEMSPEHFLGPWHQLGNNLEAFEKCCSLLAARAVGEVLMLETDADGKVDWQRTFSHEGSNGRAVYQLDTCEWSFMRSFQREPVVLPSWWGKHDGEDLDIGVVFQFEHSVRAGISVMAGQRRKAKADSGFLLWYEHWSALREEIACSYHHTAGDAFQALHQWEPDYTVDELLSVAVDDDAEGATIRLLREALEDEPAVITWPEALERWQQQTQRTVS